MDNTLIATLTNLVTLTEAEVEICKMHRAASVEGAKRLMENTDSEHFSHHLASAANAIAGHDARLRQTERILATLRTTLATAQEAK